MPLTQLLQGEPVELRELADHVQSLDFYSCPDYDRIRHLFARILVRFQVTEDTPMDWESMQLEDYADAGDLKAESGKSERTDGEDATGRDGNVVDG